MKLQTFLAAAVLASSMPATHAATLPAAEDSYGFRSKLTLAANKAAKLPVDATHRAFIYFNLADLPPGATLGYARLRLYLPHVVRTGSGLSVHQVTGTWDESLASTEPIFTATSLANFPAVGLGSKRFISVDVTSTVQAWLNTPTTNEGFAIVAIPGSTTSLTASVSLGAKEGSGSGYPAELEVEFATVSVAAGAIGTTQLATGAVQSANIAAGAVGNSQLASGLTLGGTTSGTFSGNGAALTNLAVANLIGQLSGTQLANGVVTPLKMAPDCAVFYEEAATATAGGVLSITGWQARTLNGGAAFPSSGGSISRSGNTIILQPGTYYIDAEATAYATNRHQLILRDVTTSSGGNPTAVQAVIRGLSSFAKSGTEVGNSSVMKGIITVSTSARSYELWHYAESNQDSQSGLGVATGVGANYGTGVLPKYSHISIIRLQ